MSLLTSLYEEFSIDGLEDEDLSRFFYGGGFIDAYRTECNRLSTFHLASPVRSPGDPPPMPGYENVTTITARCGRSTSSGYGGGCSGIFSISIFRDHKSIVKVGQYPSKKACDFGLLDPVFSSELKGTLRRELGAAVGLRAHGVGIGSYVYLRRILEVLIEEAHAEAAAHPGWDEDQYEKSRVVERIKMLSGSLPGALVGGADLYSILSKGIHELSGDDCKIHFDLVFQAIQLILRRRAESKAQKKIKAELNKQKSKLSTK